ncbi:MAG: DUF2147 domain-containing protein [Rhodothermaceae bacterium]|nr:DUF2147 domain-containing protein [Rhodothermaceae bacterium]
MMNILNLVAAAVVLFSGLVVTNSINIHTGEFATARAELSLPGTSWYASNKPSLTADDGSHAVTGLWLSADKRGIIRIYEQDGRFFGRLVWLLEPEDDQGNTILDSENPDPEKRDRPILGLQMVFGLEYSSGEWRNGEIYDPESGKTYSARLRLNGNNRMDLRGYIRLPMFGRTESWTRISTFPDEGKVWPGLEQE